RLHEPRHAPVLLLEPLRHEVGLAQLALALRAHVRQEVALAALVLLDLAARGGPHALEEPLIGLSLAGHLFSPRRDSYTRRRRPVPSAARESGIIGRAPRL